MWPILAVMFENFSKTKIAKKTFIFDNLRCFFAGLVEAGFKNFALVIAIRIFNAPIFAKSVIASAMGIGFFITPISQAFAARAKKMTTMQISAAYMISVALSLVLSTLARSYIEYLFTMLLAIILFRQPISLIEDVYGQNYSLKERGSRISFSLMILPLSTLILSPVFGKFLDKGTQYYKLILFAFALAAIGEAISFMQIPARVLPAQNKKSIFSNFGLMFSDKLFGIMLMLWTISGIANRMVSPLKTEYLINPKYNINASNYFEAMACVTIPCAFRFLSSPAWGKIFDKNKLITSLVALNVISAFSYILFFNTKSQNIILVASILDGVVYGGKEIMWSLWITKIAPIDKFSAYMSINVAISGLRGIIAPYIGYSLSQHLSLQQISIAASVMVLLSTFGFLSLNQHQRFMKSTD